MLLLPVLVTGEKLLLLSMKQPHHVTLPEHTEHDTAAQLQCGVKLFSDLIQEHLQ